MNATKVYSVNADGTLEKPLEMDDPNVLYAVQGPFVTVGERDKEGKVIPDGVQITYYTQAGKLVYRRLDRDPEQTQKNIEVKRATEQMKLYEELKAWAKPLLAGKEAKNEAQREFLSQYLLSQEGGSRLFELNRSFWSLLIQEAIKG